MIAAKSGGENKDLVGGSLLEEFSQVGGND